jgi:hypothetical protein
MDFLKLTENTGRTVYVNPERINAVREYGLRALIVFDTRDSMIEVTQTAETVAGLIAGVRRR